jgi:hypothetical protein
MHRRLPHGERAEKTAPALAGRLPTESNWIYIFFFPRSYLQQLFAKFGCKNTKKFPRQLTLTLGINDI